MEFPELVKRLEENEVFSEWKKTHPESFLAHVFVEVDQSSAKAYQVGYYDTLAKKITSFLINGDEVVALPPADILSEPGTTLEHLVIEGIDMSTVDVLIKVHAVREEEYAGIPVTKTFFILQHINDLDDVFNITFVTMDLKTLNIKLDARSGEVLSHSLASLIAKDDGK